MLFEMVAGYRPYRRYEHNASRLDAAIRRQEAPEPLPADADPVLVAIIRKLLAHADRASLHIGGSHRSRSRSVPRRRANTRGDGCRAGERRHRARRARPNDTDRRRFPVIPPIPTVAGPAPSQSVPTEALPRTQATVATEAIAPPPAKPVKKRSRFRTLVRYAVMFFLLSMVMRECVGLARADRLRERIDAIEADQVPAIRSEYRRIADTGPLGLGAGQVRAPLRDRMVALADRAILEFRTESPSVVGGGMGTGTRLPRVRAGALVAIRDRGEARLHRCAPGAHCRARSSGIRRSRPWISRERPAGSATHLIPTSDSRASMPIRCVRSSRSSRRSSKPNNAAISRGPPRAGADWRRVSLSRRSRSSRRGRPRRRRAHRTARQRGRRLRPMHRAFRGPELLRFREQPQDLPAAAGGHRRRTASPRR